jgi:hypothetical protein
MKTLQKHKATLQAIAYELRGTNPVDKGPEYKLGDFILSAIEIAEKETEASDPTRPPDHYDDDRWVSRRNRQGLKP